MKTLSTILVLAALSRGALAQELPLYNPFERPKNGPPLTNVFYKLHSESLWSKLKDPRYHP